MIRKMSPKIKNKLSGLYALTDPNVFQQQSCTVVTQQLIEGGARIIQYRDKISTEKTRRENATQIKKLCAAANIIFIINDDIELALATEADGVHLGKKDAAITKARKLLGKDKIIGISCYNRLDLARDAEQAGADYIAFGSFYTSATKPDALPAKPKLLTQARQKLSIPICAIGGINSNNAEPLLTAGADMLAVITALYNTPDIRQNVKRFSSLF